MDAEKRCTVVQNGPKFHFNRDFVCTSPLSHKWANEWAERATERMSEQSEAERGGASEWAEEHCGANEWPVFHSDVFGFLEPLCAVTINVTHLVSLVHYHFLTPEWAPDWSGVQWSGATWSGAMCSGTQWNGSLRSKWGEWVSDLPPPSGAQQSGMEQCTQKTTYWR